MRLRNHKKDTSSETKDRGRIKIYYYIRPYYLVAFTFILLLLSSTITIAMQLAKLDIIAKMLPRAQAISTSSSPSVFFSSNFSNALSQSPHNSSIMCGNVQIAPAQTQQNNTFVCGNNIQFGKPTSNSSFTPTSRFLQISKNLSINKSKSTSSATIKNITEGPVRFQFVNSYWTDNTAPGGIDAGSSSDRTPAQALPPVLRQEVGPGEGNSILAVVLINRGFVDVTSIRGSLQLPAGFQAIVSPDTSDPANNSTVAPTNASPIIPAANSSILNSSLTGNSSNSISNNNDSDTAIASYNGLVKAGQTFVLYFPVYVGPSAQVGKLYHGSLKLHFFTLEQERKIKSEFNTADKAKAFDLSRRINASASIQILKSLDKLDARDKSNRQITNRITPFESTSRTIDIPFRISGKVILDAIALPESQVLTGNRIQSSLVSASQLSVLSANPGSATRVALIIRNEGSATANGVIADVLARIQAATANNIVTPSVRNLSVSTNVVQQNNIIPLIILGSSTFNIGSVQANQLKKVDTAIFPSIAVAGTARGINNSHNV